MPLLALPSPSLFTLTYILYVTSVTPVSNKQYQALARNANFQCNGKSTVTAGLLCSRVLFYRQSELALDRPNQASA